MNLFNDESKGSIETETDEDFIIKIPKSVMNQGSKKTKKGNSMAKDIQEILSDPVRAKDFLKGVFIGGIGAFVVLRLIPLILNIIT